ncbi:MAG: matrixin family metalloprotease [Pseudomonadota bacterium]
MKKALTLSFSILIYIISQSSAQGVPGRSFTGFQYVVGAAPIEFPGLPIVFQEAEQIPQLWAERCAVVNYVFDSSFIPEGLEIADIEQEISAAFEVWNANPSSFIHFNLIGSQSIPETTFASSDFVNEISFVSFNGNARSLSSSFIGPAELIAGQDIDNDGDPDVFSPELEGENTCQDIDGDGDTDFPAGEYPGGTIFDNDVVLNPSVDWSVDPEDGIDLRAVITHEFGHSHGLTHSHMNQFSDIDSEEPTMNPVFNPDQLSRRSLSEDDLAWSAYYYPEGSADEGLAAVQADQGDIAFDEAYDVIKGEVHQDNQAIIGAAVTAIISNGLEERRTVMTFSGKTQSLIVADAEPIPQGFFNAIPFPDPLDAVVSGVYELPVPAGSNVTVDIEAVDGTPYSPGRFSGLTGLGSLLGQNNFPEEGYAAATESAVEFAPDETSVIYAGTPMAEDIDLILNEVSLAQNFSANPVQDLTNIPTGNVFVAAGNTALAERFNRDVFIEQFSQGRFLTGANILTTGIDQTVIPTFTEVSLMTGRLVLGDDGGEQVEIDQVWDINLDAIGQSGDFTPYTFASNLRFNLPLFIRLNSDPTLDLFVRISAEGVPLDDGDTFGVAVQDGVATGTAYRATGNGPLTLLQLDGADGAENQGRSLLVQLSFAQFGTPLVAKDDGDQTGD